MAIPELPGRGRSDDSAGEVARLLDDTTRKDYPMDDANDIRILHNLTKRYLDCASDLVYEEGRDL